MRRWFSAGARQRRVLCSLDALKALDGNAIKFPLALSPLPSEQPTAVVDTTSTNKPQQPQRRANRGGRTGFVFFCASSQVPRAFVNSCPHALLELDLDDSDFFCDGFVQCKAHGAFFDPQTGICLQGPAASRRGRLEKQLGALTALSVAVDDDGQVVLLPPTTPQTPKKGAEDARFEQEPEPRSEDEWREYRSVRQRDLGAVLATRQQDVQQMQDSVHAKTMARLQQYQNTTKPTNTK